MIPITLNKFFIYSIKINMQYLYDSEFFGIFCWLTNFLPATPPQVTENKRSFCSNKLQILLQKR